jgi:hypothetical protein
MRIRLNNSGNTLTTESINHERNSKEYYDIFRVDTPYYSFNWCNAHFAVLHSPFSVRGKIVFQPLSLLRLLFQANYTWGHAIADGSIGSGESVAFPEPELSRLRSQQQQTSTCGRSSP